MSAVVAQTILQQLGGKRFMAMTGAKNLVAGDKCLYFTIGQNQNRWNRVKVSLNWKDLYDMTFYRIRHLDIVDEQTVSDLYAESLQDAFTEHTGLYTRL